MARKVAVHMDRAASFVADPVQPVPLHLEPDFGMGPLPPPAVAAPLAVPVLLTDGVPGDRSAAASRAVFAHALTEIERTVESRLAARVDVREQEAVGLDAGGREAVVLRRDRVDHVRGDQVLVDPPPITADPAVEMEAGVRRLGFGGPGEDDV